MTSAIKRNNPGNIGLSNWTRRLPGVIDTGERFPAFFTPHDGLNAIGRLLLVYQDQHGLDTLLADAQRYAPSDDGNDPISYAHILSDFVGRNPTDKIDYINYLPQMIAGHVRAENSKNPDTGQEWYTNDEYTRAAVSSIAQHNALKAV